MLPWSLIYLYLPRLPYTALVEEVEIEEVEIEEEGEDVDSCSDCFILDNTQ